MLDIKSAGYRSSMNKCGTKGICCKIFWIHCYFLSGCFYFCTLPDTMEKLALFFYTFNTNIRCSAVILGFWSLHQLCDLVVETCNNRYPFHLLFPASPQARAPWQPTSWHPAATSGVAKTRTRATTRRATCRPTTRGCRCCSLTASWASSWCRGRCPGTTTSWVSFSFPPPFSASLDAHFSPRGSVSSQIVLLQSTLNPCHRISSMRRSVAEIVDL